MPATNPYPVPAPVIGDQVLAITSALQAAPPESRARLAGAGCDGAAIASLERHAAELLELDRQHVSVMLDEKVSRAHTNTALQALVRWRVEKVLPRAQLLFRDTPLFTHFRAGELRSHREAVVTREARFLIAAIRRVAHLPEAHALGLHEDMAAEGQRMLDDLVTADDTHELARATLVEAACALREKALEVSLLLKRYEQQVGIAFAADATGRKRHGLREVRTYLARSRGRKKAAKARAQAAPERSARVATRGPT